MKIGNVLKIIAAVAILAGIIAGLAFLHSWMAKCRILPSY